LSYYQQALPILRKVKDRPGEAATLANIGSMHGHLSRYEEALKYLQQALMIHRAVKNRQGEAATLNNIGSAYGARTATKKR
jgi:tetratricopeptide (TPR) repeat protein